MNIMEKEKIMTKFNKFVKNTIIVLGLIFISLIIILNLVYSVRIYNGMSENVIINQNTFLFTMFLIIILAVTYYILYQTEKIKVSKKVNKLIFITLFIIYIILQIVWINVRCANPNHDQYYVYDTAIRLKEKNENLIGDEYLQTYPQQVSTATFYAIILKIFNTNNVIVLQYLNIIANAFTIFGLYLIAKQIANKDNKFNKGTFILLAFTYTALPLLSTFIYGDLISLPFAIFGIYFAVKYVKEDNIKFIIFSGLSMSMAYFLRMNSLIFIIAITIYLFLGLLKVIQNKEKAKIIIKTILIILFIIISILPSKLYISFMQEKLKLNKEKSYPTIGWLTIGVTLSTRGAGWYVDPYVDIWKSNGQDATFLKENYIKMLTYYKENPVICINFYLKKILSMWAEPSFASLWYNLSFNFGNMSVNEGTATEEQIKEYEKVDNVVYKLYNFIMIYEKIILMLVFMSVLLLILRNKELSNEQVLLILVFIGGFLFHILWEAKSRYVIPYFIVLIPLASIGIKQNVEWVQRIIKQIKSKIIETKNKVM